MSLVGGAVGSVCVCVGGGGYTGIMLMGTFVSPHPSQSSVFCLQIPSHGRADTGGVTDR